MAKSATIGLNLDITAFRKSLSSAISGAKSLAGLKPSVKIGVDTSQVDAAENKIDGLSSTQTVKINVDTKGAEKGAGGLSKKLGGLGAIAGGALGGAAAQGVTALGGKLFEGAKAADEFGDRLEVAFTQQGIADVEGEIEKVRKSSLALANDLGLPVERTRELAGSVATLGGFTGKSAEDLTKLSAGLEVFTNGAVKGEAVAKAFAKGVNDPEGQAAIDALSKKYPQLAETLRSNLSPTEKLAKANEVLGKSFETVKDQQGDVGGILNKLQNQLGEVFEKIGGDLLNALIPIAQAVLPIVESLLPILQSVLSALTPILQQVGGVVVELVKTLSGPLTNLLQAVLLPVVGIIEKLLPVILQLVQAALTPLGAIIDVVAVVVKELLSALDPVVDIIVDFIPIVAGLVGELVTGLVPVVKALAPILVTLVKNILSNKLVLGALELTLNIVAGALRLVVDIVNGLVGAATVLIQVIGNVITYISNLVNAIATFDLNAIKNAILGISDAQNQGAKSAKANAEATDKAAGATDKLADANKNLNKNQANTDPEAAKKYAEALKAARVALAGLNTEQAKARELAAADLIAGDVERARKRLEIETKYAADAIEAERKALTSTKELREAEEAVINKRLEILREESANKLRDINAKAEADRVKAAEEAEKKIAEITTRLAEDRVAKLRAVLEAGGVGVASELIAAQRAVIDNQLSSAVDAIVESTPDFKSGAAKIGNELLAGIIDGAEAQKRTADLRQKVTGELLALPSDAANVYSKQIRAAYDRAASDIASGTQDVTDAIKKAIGKSGTEQYVDSLYGIRDAIAGADFSTPFQESAEATQASNDALNELIQSVKDGEETYQSAALKYAELDKERGDSATATAAVITEALKAAAQSQLDAANESIARITELRNRNQEIADELVSIEERKNAALAQLRAQDFANQQLFESARAEIAAKAASEEQKLQAEQTANTQSAADSQEAALRQIYTAAGVAFAGLVTGSQEAGEALQSIVGETVSALIKLYTPAILAGFQTIVPGPIGFVLGTAAVATLQALLSSALAGFSEGGYTGNAGTSQVAGLVHGREFVINAGATQKNRGLLEHINKGGTVDTFGSAPVTELQMMRAELQAIRQRLDSMPNGINGRQAVALDVGFDTYLFERDRRRVAVRGIRG